MMEGKSSISIKTRIETIHASIELVKTRKVKVVYPLKQGLKPSSVVLDTLFSLTVKVVYPLKQGLKHTE